jgi:hypothetical protein
MVQNLIMADHLVTKFWGWLGAIALALLTLLVIAPASAEASGSVAGALSQLSSVVPAPAKAAVAGALAQVPSPPVTAAPSPPLVPPEPPPPVPTVGPPASTVVTHIPAVSAPAQSMPQPDVAVSTSTISVPTVTARATGTRSNPPPAPTRSGPSLGGQASAHGASHPTGHRAGHRGLQSLARPALRSTGPIVARLTGRPFLPLAGAVGGIVGSGAAHPSPAAVAAARDAHARKRSDRTRHIAAPAPAAVSAVSTPQLAPPISGNLPPGGADGNAAGSGPGAAGAAGAALLAVVGISILRALLPGLLGLGLAPARSTLLVSRLERPG